MTPEEIKQAKRVILSGILMRNDRVENTRDPVTVPESLYHEWLKQVHDPMYNDGLIKISDDATEWEVTKKGLKFLAEE